MHNTLLIALLAGLGGMLGWGFADFFAKKAVDAVGPIKSLVWSQTFGAVLFILLGLGQIFVLHHAIVVPSSASVWLALFVFGVLQTIVYWFAYQGFEKGQLAVLNPVFASYSGIVALFAVIFFGEKLSTALAVALVAVFAGNMLLNVDIKALRSKQLKVTPGLKEMAVAALLAAGWTLGWDRFINGRDALSAALFMYGFMTLAAFGLARFMKVKFSGIDGSLWKFLFLMGAGEAAAYLAISWGFSATPLVGLVALLSGAFSVPAVLLAFAFLKERVSKLQAAAICIIVAGIVIVALNT